MIMALLLRYMHKIGKRGVLIKTVGVSKLLDVVADKLGVETITTPVGFKWLSEKMRENKTLLAGEDSGGLSIGEHIPEKDGLLANLLIIEMLAGEKKTLNKLISELKEFAKCEFYTDRIDVKLEDNTQAQNLTEKFDNYASISSLDVKEKLTIDGTKLFLDDGLTSLLIRKSGTEPLLRFYIESDSIFKLNEVKKFVEQNTI